MKKTYRESVNMWALDADDGYILHRKGEGDYPEIHHTTVRDPEAYEEVAMEDIPLYTESEYKAKVEELIRERYSASDEFALINNVMSGATEKRQSEYAEYQAYREACKARAKEILKGLKYEPPKRAVK